MPIKDIQKHVVDSAADHVAKEPIGVIGDVAIAFGAGASSVGKKKKRIYWKSQTFSTICDCLSHHVSSNKMLLATSVTPLDYPLNDKFP